MNSFVFLNKKFDFFFFGLVSGGGAHNMQLVKEHFLLLKTLVLKLNVYYKNLTISFWLHYGKIEPYIYSGDNRVE